MDANSTCQNIQPMLSAFFDNELGQELGGQYQLVTEHLKTCLDCQKELVQIEKISKALRQMPKATPGRDLSAEISRRVLEKKAPTKVAQLKIARDNVRQFPRKLALTGIAAAAAIGMLGWQFLAQETVISDKPDQQPIQQLATQLPDKQVSSTQVKRTIGKLEVAKVQVKKPLVVAQHKQPQPSLSNHDNHDLVAYDDGYQPSVMEAMGLATDEDGLYALKM